MNSIGLYLHFPFCKAKCKYCDFYSLSDLSPISSFEKAMVRCIREFSRDLKDKRVETVYLGGGTPSLMTADGVKSVLGAVRENFSLCDEGEITMEFNPESTDEKILSAAVESGVNRISFGMQSALDGELLALGRLHTQSETVRAVEMAREAGIENISLDLMYGLPGQTPASFQKSLEACVHLAPKHISFYCLTLSPSVPLYEKRALLPGEEEQREMYLFAHSFLEERGYEHYEISNAALPGFHSRHNRIYWQGGEYLGLGPGAHSFLSNRRFFMEEDREKFLQASSFRDLFCVEESLEEKDLLTEYILLSLRLSSGIDLKRLRALSDEAFLKKSEEKFRLWESYRLCRRTERGYALTPEGFFVSNEIISELI